MHRFWRKSVSTLIGSVTPSLLMSLGAQAPAVMTTFCELKSPLLVLTMTLSPGTMSVTQWLSSSTPPPPTNNSCRWTMQRLLLFSGLIKSELNKINVVVNQVLIQYHSLHVPGRETLLLPCSGASCLAQWDQCSPQAHTAVSSNADWSGIILLVSSS